MSNKKFLLELTEQEAEQLTELAAAHGNKFKPFAEYLLRLQLGAVKPPIVQPVVIPEQEHANRKLPKVEPEQKTAKVKPPKEQPRTVTPEQEQPQEDTVKETDKAGQFLRRLGRWTNGKCYRKETDEGAFVYSYI